MNGYYARKEFHIQQCTKTRYARTCNDLFANMRESFVRETCQEEMAACVDCKTRVLAVKSGQTLKGAINSLCV